MPVAALFLSTSWKKQKQTQIKVHLVKKKPQTLYIINTTFCKYHTAILCPNYLINPPHRHFSLCNALYNTHYFLSHKPTLPYSLSSILTARCVLLWIGSSLSLRPSFPSRSLQQWHHLLPGQPMGSEHMEPCLPRRAMYTRDHGHRDEGMRQAKEKLSKGYPNGGFFWQILQAGFNLRWFF